MTSVAAPFHPTHTTGSWEDFENRVGGAAPALALFALGCAPLLWLDMELRERISSTVLLTPSAGLLFVALWMSRPSRWPALLVIHVLIALVVSRPDDDAWHPTRDPACHRSRAGLRRLRRHRHHDADPRAHTAGHLAGASAPSSVCALGGLAGSLFTLLLRGGTGPVGPTYTYDLLSVWASLGLGLVTLGSVTLMWLLKIRSEVPELLLQSRRLLVGITAWVLAAGLFGIIFLREPHTTPIVMPILAGPALVLGCFRLPPRWALTLSALFILEFAFITTHRDGPFSVTDPECARQPAAAADRHLRHGAIPAVDRCHAAARHRDRVRSSSTRDWSATRNACAATRASSRQPRREPGAPRRWTCTTASARRWPAC